MSYVKKTDRPKAYPDKTLRAMATLASKTSMWNAADEFKVSWATIRRACRITGIKPWRRPSNAMAKMHALKMRSEGKTYVAIGRAVGYSCQSIYDWCKMAGVIVDRRRKAA